MMQDEIEAAAKAHCDFFGGEGWWDTGFTADTKPMALDAMRAAIAALDAARGKAEPVPFAWATWHDPPMLFLSHGEARLYCDDDENPIPLYAHPPAPDEARGDPVARLIAHMKTIEPDEETAGCPATWADFIQILEGIAEAGEPFNG